MRLVEKPQVVEVSGQKPAAASGQAIGQGICARRKSGGGGTNGSLGTGYQVWATYHGFPFSLSFCGIGPRCCVLYQSVSTGPASFYSFLTYLYLDCHQDS